MKVLKGIFFAVALLIATGSVNAETVSQKEASAVAAKFFNELNGRVMSAPKLVWNGKRLTTNRLFTPFYVYNHPTGGFVIISAENKAFPILGFSETSNFSPDRLTETEEVFLRRFAQEVENIRYDSRIPDEAISAWGDINEYIYEVVHDRKDISDSRFTANEGSEDIYRIADNGMDEFFSDMYTPSQWENILREEYASSKSVALGLITERDIFPTVVRGVKGDYFRLDLPEGNDWNMRISATEYLLSPMVAVSSLIKPAAEIEDLEQPFRFYEEFLEESEAARNRIAGIEQGLGGTTSLLPAGGGHFAIRIPENVKLARIYSLSGAMVDERYYKNTDTAHVDLSINPSGFYIALLISETGKPYGFKLYR